MLSGGVAAASNNYIGAGYLIWMSNGWAIDARLAGGAVHGRTSRTVSISGVDETLAGAPGGWSLLADAEAGRRFRLFSVDLELYAGLMLQTYRQEAYAETGDVGVDLPGQYFSRAQTALGTRLATGFDIAGLAIRSHADIAWTRDAGLTTHVVFFDEPFVIEAAPPGPRCRPRQGRHLHRGVDRIRPVRGL